MSNFKKLKIKDNVFKLNDNVFVKSSTECDYIGKILEIRLLSVNNKSLENVRVKCQWYYRVNETNLASQPFASKNELFLSDIIEEVEGSTINSFANVLTLDEYENFDFDKAEDPTFFMRAKLHEVKQKYVYEPSIFTWTCYCICKFPQNPDQLQVECSSCNNWYHPECIHLTQDIIDSDEDWYCVKCTDGGGDQEPPASTFDISLIDDNITTRGFQANKLSRMSTTKDQNGNKGHRGRVAKVEGGGKVIGAKDDNLRLDGQPKRKPGRPRKVDQQQVNTKADPIESEGDKDDTRKVETNDNAEIKEKYPVEDKKDEPNNERDEVDQKEQDKLNKVTDGENQKPTYADEQKVEDNEPVNEKDQNEDSKEQEEKTNDKNIDKPVDENDMKDNENNKTNAKIENELKKSDENEKAYSIKVNTIESKKEDVPDDETQEYDYNDKAQNLKIQDENKEQNMEDTAEKNDQDNINDLNDNKEEKSEEHYDPRDDQADSSEIKDRTNDNDLKRKRDDDGND